MSTSLVGFVDEFIFLLRYSDCFTNKTTDGLLAGIHRLDSLLRAMTQVCVISDDRVNCVQDSREDII